VKNIIMRHGREQEPLLYLKTYTRFTNGCVIGTHIWYGLQCKV